MASAAEPAAHLSAAGAPAAPAAHLSAAGAPAAEVPPPPEGARKRAREGGSKWRHVRALTKFIKLSIDVNRVPKETVPTDDEIRSLGMQLFVKYDKDKNGTLDFHEFEEMLLDLGVSHACLHKNRVQQYIRQVDVNHDKVISFDEFLVCYKSLLTWDCEGFTLRAPFKLGMPEQSSPPHAPPSPLDNCPRTTAAPVLVDGVEFVVSQRYKLESIIGRGAYGVIASAVDTTTGSKVVIKRVAAIGHPIELQATLRELLILQHLRRHPHDNLLPLSDITPPSVGPLDAWHLLYLIMPRMDCDLHAIIRSSQPLSDEHCQFFSYQLLRGLLALHSSNVVHRDLKPSNLLVNRDCTLRIADFGISRQLGSEATNGSRASELESEAGPEQHVSPLTNYVVTRYYRAPELLLECSAYGFEVDVWSVACIMAEMMLRRPLCCGTSVSHQLTLISDLLGPPTEPERVELLARHSASPQRMQLITAERQAAAWASRKSVVGDVLRASSTFVVKGAGGIELVEGMLRYLPAERTSVPDALRSKWLSELHECNAEPKLPPLLMPSHPERGCSRKRLQLAAIECVREMHPLESAACGSGT